MLKDPNFPVPTARPRAGPESPRKLRAAPCRCAQSWECGGLPAFSERPGPLTCLIWTRPPPSVPPARGEGSDLLRWPAPPPLICLPNPLTRLTVLSHIPSRSALPWLRPFGSVFPRPSLIPLHLHWVSPWSRPITPDSVSPLPFPLFPQPPPLWVNANHKSIHSEHSLGPLPILLLSAKSCPLCPFLLVPLLVLPIPAGAEMRAAQSQLANPQHPNAVLVKEVSDPPQDIRQWRKVG